jgi:hypothetical protein
MIRSEYSRKIIPGLKAESLGSSRVTIYRLTRVKENRGDALKNRFKSSQQGPRNDKNESRNDEIGIFRFQLSVFHFVTS